MKNDINFFNYISFIPLVSRIPSMLVSQEKGGFTWIKNKLLLELSGHSRFHVNALILCTTRIVKLSL